jgi:hypothetical protein
LTGAVVETFDLFGRALAARALVRQGGGQGRCRHRGLLGGHRPVQQHDDDEAQRAVDAAPPAGPEGRQAERADGEPGEGGRRDQGAAAIGPLQHQLVLGAIACDVVLAGLGAALGHLPRQQRIEQGLDALAARVELVEVVDDVHRDALALELRHHAGRGAAAVVELRALPVVVVERGDPGGVSALEQQLEQRAQVARFRRTGQQPRLHACELFAAEGQARTEAEVGKKRGRVDVAPEGVGEPAHPGRGLGVLVELPQQRPQPQGGQWRAVVGAQQRGRGRVAQPFGQAHQPQVAFGETGLGVGGVDEGGEISGAGHRGGASARRVGAARQCRVSVQCIGMHEYELGHGGLKGVGLLAHAEEGAAHAAVRRVDAGPARVFELLARLQQGLMAHHGEASDFFGAAVGVGHEPLARHQLRRLPAGVVDGHGVGKGIGPVGLLRLLGKVLHTHAAGEFGSLAHAGHSRSPLLKCRE